MEDKKHTNQPNHESTVNNLYNERNVLHNRLEFTRVLELALIVVATDEPYIHPAIFGSFFDTEYYIFLLLF